MALSLSRIAQAAALATALFAAPARSWAQSSGDPSEAKAIELFEEAKKLLADRNYGGACPKFLQSYELARSKPGTLYALAECYAEAGKTASAVQRYDAYIRAVDELPQDRRASHNDRKKRAQKMLSTLTPQVPEVTVELPPGAPPGTSVAIDGQAIDTESIGKPRPVDPGEHVLVTNAPGQAPLEERFSIAQEEKKRLVGKVTSKATPDAAPDGPALPPDKGGKSGSGETGGGGGLRLGGFLAIGVGAAGIIGGAVTGGLVFSKKGAVQDGCVTPLPDGTVGCTQEGLDAANGAKAFGTVSTIAIGVGVAGAALGTVLLVLAPKKTSASASQRWIAVRAGGNPTGCTLGVSGSF